MAPDTDGVSCTFAHSDRGTEQVKVPWLIACDGAHSTVRHALGMEFRGETLPTDWLLADVHLKGLGDPLSIQIYWNEEGVLALLPLGGNRYRVIADVGQRQSSISETERALPTIGDVEKLLRSAAWAASRPTILSGSRCSASTNEWFLNIAPGESFWPETQRTCIVLRAARE